MNKTKPIQVMIVDDHGMVRRGLAAYLQSDPDIEVVAEASDGQEAIQLCEQHLPDGPGYARTEWGRSNPDYSSAVAGDPGDRTDQFPGKGTGPGSFTGRGDQLLDKKCLRRKPVGGHQGFLRWSADVS